MSRGADIVARTLQDLGVTRIFTLSGNHIMPIFDALLSTNIQLIHARHEAACVHMADAWGRLTGEPGIALVTGGQGHSNAVAALYNGAGVGIPVAAAVRACAPKRTRPRRFPGNGAGRPRAPGDQSVVDGAPQWRHWVRISPRHSNLRPRGVPVPCMSAFPSICSNGRLRRSRSRGARKQSFRLVAASLSPEVADNVISHLRAAAKPLVICGPAMCTERGRKTMREAADALDVPVIGMESPRGINDPGLGAFAEILTEADLVVLIGKPLDFTLRFGEAPALSPSCKWIVIDPDPAMIARAEKAMGQRLLLSEVADAQIAIETLTERSATPHAPSAWREHVSEVARLRTATMEVGSREQIPASVHPVEMCRAIGSFIEKHPGATFVSDGGEIGQWAQALVKTDRRMINGVAGTIGVSLPFAIAAQLALRIIPWLP